MSISDPVAERVPATARRRLLAAAALAALFALVAEAASALAGLRPAPHPAWIAVMLMGARYGSGGFLAGVAAAGAGAAIGAAGTGGAVAAWSGARGGADLAALGACLAVSWVASLHLRRESRLREQVGSLLERNDHLEAAVAETRDLVDSLRARANRTSASLSFLRDAARRLEGDDPREAAEAAADLALVRSGASLVTIETVEGVVGRRLALRSSVAPGGRFLPETEAPAHAVSIRMQGDRVGVIALWGLPARTLDQAVAHDLGVIASWCAPAVAAARAVPAFATGGGTEPS